MIHMRAYNTFEAKNVKFLVNKSIDFTTIQITETGYKKSILDATGPVRTYFLEHGVHNYDVQPQGTEHKILKRAAVLTQCEIYETEISLYRPTTKKGDPRLWVMNFKKHIRPDEIFAIISHNECLYVVNLSQVEIESAYNSCINSPLKDLILEITSKGNSIADELFGMIKDRLSDWVLSEVSADTGIGRTVESVLGIAMNDSKAPDYKGIELKSKRYSAKVRNTLFTQTPNWNISRLKSGHEIVDAYGYTSEDDSVKRMHITLRSHVPNRQRLALNVDEVKAMLEANEYIANENYDGTNNKYKKVNDVVVWKLINLHERLITKHHETFWINVDNRIEGNKEYFRVKEIVHTKNPVVPQFDTLLDQGSITVDFLLNRRTGGDTYSFKIASKARPLLFPESELLIVNP